MRIALGLLLGHGLRLRTGARGRGPRTAKAAHPFYPFSLLVKLIFSSSSRICEESYDTSIPSSAGADVHIRPNETFPQKEQFE